MPNEVDVVVDSSVRFGLDPAPYGLVLVQDVLNTRRIGELAPDVLEHRQVACSWLENTLGKWSRQTGNAAPRPARSLDLVALRELREGLHAWLAGEVAQLPVQPAVLSIGGAHLTYQPTEQGAAGIVALVYTELLLARAAGTLPRLKVCANPACGAAFYDVSRNSSRRWHDVKTCGNVANLRASRERRRTTDDAMG